jgi:hypothetical protein
VKVFRSHLVVPSSADKSAILAEVARASFRPNFKRHHAPGQERAKMLETTQEDSITSLKPSYAGSSTRPLQIFPLIVTESKHLPKRLTDVANLSQRSSNAERLVTLLLKQDGKKSST